MSGPQYTDVGDTTPISEINMTPLVDIVLVLLIVFMIAMPSIAANENGNERELNVELPHASQASEATGGPIQIVVNVRDSGEFVTDGEVMNRQQLDERLQLANRVAQGKVVTVIRADRRVAWDHVLTVMDLCRAAGIKDCRAATVGD